MTDDYEATLGEVGKELGVGPERTRQIQEGALRTMRLRLRQVGIDASDATPGVEEPDPYLRIPQCLDCNEELSSARETRCPPCEAHEDSRRAGYEQAAFAHRAHDTGLWAILSRWQGTTT